MTILRAFYRKNVDVMYKTSKNCDKSYGTLKDPGEK